MEKMCLAVLVLPWRTTFKERILLSLVCSHLKEKSKKINEVVNWDHLFS